MTLKVAFLFLNIAITEQKLHFKHKFLKLNMKSSKTLQNSF